MGAFSSEDGWKVVLSQQHDTEERNIVEGKELLITDKRKQLWEGVSKEDVMNYYFKIYPTIFPYLKDRPLGLNVSINGVNEEGVFIRGLEGNYPEWATIFKTERKNAKAGKSPFIDWLVCNDLATLIWMVNLGCIDIHVWNSRKESFNNPDYIVIDLDPSDGDFEKVINTTLAVKHYLDENNLIGFVKTSGQTGMHVFVPCEGIGYGNARKIGEIFSKSINALVPEITTIAPLKKNRGDKLYVDPSQNDFSDRMATAYCVRSFESPNVSTPLRWEEITTDLNPANFTMNTIFDRLQRFGDLWQDLLKEDHKKHNTEILNSLLS